MRSKTTTWFETKVRYEKVMEGGFVKKVTEQYVVDALSFTEAESSIIEEMSYFISGDFTVSEIKRASYREVFFSDKPSDDKWYKAKVAFITIDEKTSKEKKTNAYYLVQDATFEGARKAIDEVMGGSLLDYVIDTISETKILDVYEHKTTNRHIEEVNIKDMGGLDNVLNCKLAKPVVRTFKETFKDADTGEEVEIERNQVIAERLRYIDGDLVQELLDAGIQSVHIYTNDHSYSKD